MNIVYYRYSSKIIVVMYILRENKEWNFRVDVKLFEN